MSDKPPFHNPFAALGGLPGVPRPDPGTPADVVADERAEEAAAAARIARAVVRYERAGRKGKAVTVVDKLGLDERALGEWLKALKGSLGCGGTVEDGRIVLQGDHRTRLPPLLAARGVRKVTVG